MAATRCAPIDPVERDLVSAQLDELALAHDGQPWSRWKNAVLEWHLRALATARAEVWVPGLTGPQHPAVEEALNRFYRYHMRAAISRLRDENVVLRRKLIEALDCARFYANGGDDHGARASVTMHDLVPHGPAAAAAGIESKRTQSH
jgi:hypothetical protein